MANKDYNFQYTPLTGRLPGNSFVKQTERAINELAGIVNDGAAQVEVITNLANTANANSEEALEKANEALETSGRVYITLPNLSDADDYFDSQLYYFANSYSHNLPVADTGFLEVKTNDTKTACEQVFIADDTGLCYFRHGVITSSEVGEETVYRVTWETWSSALASEDYVQQEVNIGVDTANSYTDEQISDEITRADEKYLPLSGGTMTGAIKGNPVTLTADDGNNTSSLVLGADGSLVLDGKSLSNVPDLSVFADTSDFISPTVFSNRVNHLGNGYKKVGNIVYVFVTFLPNALGSAGIWNLLSGFPTSNKTYPMSFYANLGDNVNSSKFVWAMITPGGFLAMGTNGSVSADTDITSHAICVQGYYYTAQ